MAYGQPTQQPGSRDSITQTLLSILKPQPRPQIPQMQPQQAMAPAQGVPPVPPMNSMGGMAGQGAAPPPPQVAAAAPPPQGAPVGAPNNLRGGMSQIGQALGERYNGAPPQQQYSQV